MNTASFGHISTCSLDMFYLLSQFWLRSSHAPYLSSQFHTSTHPSHPTTFFPPLRLIVLGIIHLVSVMKSEGGTDRGGKKKENTRDNIAG